MKDLDLVLQSKRGNPLSGGVTRFVGRFNGIDARRAGFGTETGQDRVGAGSDLDYGPARDQLIDRSAKGASSRLASARWLARPVIDVGPGWVCAANTRTRLVVNCL